MGRSTIPIEVVQVSAGRPLPVGVKPYVVVIFGRTGAGISSLVNLITEHPVSDNDPDAKPFTKKLKLYSPVTFPESNKQFCLYEVPGFQGRFSEAAILDAIRQIDQRDGIDLFMYCLRKQKSAIIPQVVRYIRERVAGPDVPMIAVVTELERFEPKDGDMEEWWTASPADGNTNMNGTLIERMCFGTYNTFDGHACVTTLPRKEVDHVPYLRKRRDSSEERIRQLILDQCTRYKRRGE